MNEKTKDILLPASEAIKMVDDALKQIDISSELHEISKSIVNASIIGVRTAIWTPRDYIGINKQHALKRALEECGYTATFTMNGNGIQVSW